MGDGAGEAGAEPKNKAELLARIHGARAELEGLIGGLDEARLTAPGPEGWSIKDHLAHLALWRLSLLALLEGQDRDAALGLGGAAGAIEDIDARNAILYERNKDRSLPQTLADFRGTHHLVLARLDGMTDEDLFRPYSHYQPHDPPYNADPVIGWIVGNTCGHDDEHRGWIGTIVDRQRPRA